MEIEAANGPDWSAIAPLIQARQLAMDARIAPDKDDQPSKATADVGKDLTDSERRMIEHLKARDREVRDHEQAHARVGGAYAGEPSYSYQLGPDGKRYAIGGEVKIDVSPVPDDPKATITKMEIVKAAALAPAEPSAADRQVAAQADAQTAAARADLAALRREEFRAGVDYRV